jgi:hypothetical protein
VTKADLASMLDTPAVTTNDPPTVGQSAPGKPSQQKETGLT